ncbi:MAG TPA: YciI family protein [Mycobacteriales bacterium]|nr:YciI family protein [Mycobacteriales bacterium]
MKQYLLAVHHVDGTPAPTPDVMQTMYTEVDAVNKAMMAAGAWVFGGGLLAPDISTVVTVTDGTTTTTDGPFAKAKEHLGGFWVLKCADLDAALSWAEKASAACRGPVEVRPFDEAPQD